MPNPKPWSAAKISRLKYQRVVKRMRIDELAQDFGLSEKTIVKRLHRHGIVLFPKRQSKHYVERPMTEIHLRLDDVVVQAARAIATRNHLSLTEQLRRLVSASIDRQ